MTSTATRPASGTSTITVVRPDHEVAGVEEVRPAARRRPDDGERLHLTLIENGKPNAGRLLGYVADELRSRLPLAGVDVHSKPAAGAPIDAEVAGGLAARAHLVISGVGD